jgi:hypothetical protein
MKRDKELIKAILEYAENYQGKGSPIIKLEHLPDIFHDVEFSDFIRHGKLLLDSGLIKGCADRLGIEVSMITWSGYEFLDNARNPKIWNAAKKAAGDLSWGVFVNVLTATATDYAKSIIRDMFTP